jgi:hypothetical protein
MRAAPARAPRINHDSSQARTGLARGQEYVRFRVGEPDEFQGLKQFTAIGPDRPCIAP